MASGLTDKDGNIVTCPGCRSGDVGSPRIGQLPMTDDLATSMAAPASHLDGRQHEHRWSEVLFTTVNGCWDMRPVCGRCGKVAHA